ncbi:MAG TPA: phosphatase domain-containing protein [Thermoanaerobaculia bacterium]|nr:phosphatase domain-containing protein [Thermoanaerobaculia bacterium]
MGLRKMGWRDEVKRIARDAANKAEELFDTGKRRLAERFPRNRERYVQPYRGYASETALWVGGRVLEQKPPGGPQDDDGLWENLLNTYRRWESDEVPDEPVTLMLAGRSYETHSDDEGYAFFEVPLAAPLPRGESWHQGHLALGVVGEAPEGEPAAAAVEVMTVPPSASFGVISDVDDTVLHTGVTDLVTAARLTFLGNAKTRKPLDGVAALYRAFRNGVGGDGEPHANPIFYVSSSAWNLYDLLADFLDLNDIPRGPLMLQDVGFSGTLSKGDHRHKLEKATAIVDAFPHLPFVLIGDSGQHDAALYAELARERPGRVIAIYIRDVDPGEASTRDEFVAEHGALAEQHGVPLLHVGDGLEIAAHAVELGLLAPSFLEAVRASKDRDEVREEEGVG